VNGVIPGVCSKSGHAKQQAGLSIDIWPPFQT
jgi:murein endopeptidase